MLIGRYGMIVPILALAGSMAAKRRVAPSLGTFPTTGPLFVRPAHRRDRHRRRAHLLPGPRAGPDRRAAPPERREGLLSLTHRSGPSTSSRGTRRFQRFVTLGGAKPSGEPPRPRGVLDPDLLRAALPQAFRKLDPRLLIRNPVMFVVEITAVLVTLIAIANVTGLAAGRAAPAASGSRSRSRSGCGSRSCSRPTPRPSPRRAAGPRRPPCARRARRRRPTAARADGTLEDVGSSELRKGDIIVVEEGETIPGDGDVIEGVGFVNEAAITGESAPVLKEPGTDIRSSRHRRHDARQRPARRPRHGRPGRDLPRPDDRPRRGRQAPADAQRDRPRDPARRPDHRLPDGRPSPCGRSALYAGDDRRHGRPRRPARLPHPDDDRRPAVGHRHRRHGPRRALQRAGHERPRRRGLGRRRRHPARQDRHDHLRQPARRLDHPGARASPRREAVDGRARRRRSRTRRRRAARSSSSPASAWPSSAAPAGDGDDAGLRGAGGDDRRGDPVPRRDPHQRRPDRRPARRSSRAPSTPSPPNWSAACRPRSSAEPTGSPTSAPRRSPSRATAASSGVIELKDTVKEGLVERFAEFRRMGIRTVMITGDNPRTAATIAREAGVDDFIAQATPEDKIALHPHASRPRATSWR